MVALPPRTNTHVDSWNASPGFKLAWTNLGLRDHWLFRNLQRGGRTDSAPADSGLTEGKQSKQSQSRNMEPPRDLDLTKTEKILWQALSSYRGISFGEGDPRELESPDDWGPDRVIRGHVLSEIILRTSQQKDARNYRIQIQWIRVTGCFELSDVEVDLAIYFTRCYFVNGIDIRRARLRALHANLCIMEYLDAEGATIDGFFAFGHSVAERGVTLVGCQVTKSVALDGSRVVGDDKPALNADGIKVDGDLFLRRGSASDGAVLLRGASIGGELDCSGSQFSCPGTDALAADRASVGGNVVLRGLGGSFGRFHASGEVRFAGARIVGDLDCGGGLFDNEARIALAADAADIGGSVWLTGDSDQLDRFHAIGEVRLSGSKIAGQLVGDGGRFENSGGIAFGADKVLVAGSAKLGAGFQATGQVRMLSARISGQVGFEGEIEDVRGGVLNLQEARADSLWLKDVGFDSVGKIVLIGARVLMLADDLRTLEYRGTTFVLDGFVYEQIAPDSPQDVHTRLRWLRRQDPGYHPQPYDQLAGVFRRSGRDQEARDVLISKRRVRRESLRMWYSKIWDTLLDWTVLYGWQPWRPLAVGVFALLVAIGLVAWAQSAGLVVGQSEDKMSAFHPLVYALDVFLPIIDLGVESSWTIDTSGDNGIAWIVTWYLWFVRVVGWGTITLALAALTGMVKRD